MNVFYKALFTTLLFPLFSFAQSNYKPGYVVNLKGDTLKGFIDHKEWEKNPTDINFKYNLNDKPTINCTVSNTSAFAVNGLEYFKQFVVRISQDQVQMSNIKQGVDTSTIKGAVFLRMLTQGKNITIFSYTDKIKTRYYVLDATEKEPQELIYRIYYSFENSALVQTENRYRGQMEYLAQKYHANDAKTERKISDAGYFETDLVKIAELVNGDKNKQLTPKGRFGIGLFAGLSVTFNNESFIGAIQYANNTSAFPKISGGFDFFPNKNTQQLFLRVELSVSEAQHAFASIPDDLGNSNSLSNVVDHNITLTPQVVYNIYNTDKLKAFINIGANINGSFYNKYVFTQTFNGLVSTNLNQFPDFLAKWVAFPLKTGLTFNKKLEVYIGYTLQTTLTNDYNEFAGKVSEYEAGIHYLLSVK